MAFEEYARKISKLRTDKNRKRWPEITDYQAPHKPFLLLSVMDHFAQGEITENFIEPSPDLVDTFNVYWSSTRQLGSHQDKHAKRNGMMPSGGPISVPWPSF